MEDGPMEKSASLTFNSRSRMCECLSTSLWHLGLVRIPKLLPSALNGGWINANSQYTQSADSLQEGQGHAVQRAYRKIRNGRILDLGL